MCPSVVAAFSEHDVLYKRDGGWEVLHRMTSCGGLCWPLESVVSSVAKAF